MTTPSAHLIKMLHLRNLGIQTVYCHKTSLDLRRGPNPLVEDTVGELWIVEVKVVSRAWNDVDLDIRVSLLLENVLALETASYVHPVLVAVCCQLRPDPKSRTYRGKWLGCGVCGSGRQLACGRMHLGQGGGLMSAL